MGTSQSRDPAQTSRQRREVLPGSAKWPLDGQNHLPQYWRNENRRGPPETLFCPAFRHGETGQPPHHPPIPPPRGLHNRLKTGNADRRERFVLAVTQRHQLVRVPTNSAFKLQFSDLNLPKPQTKISVFQSIKMAKTYKSIRPGPQKIFPFP